MQVRSLASLSGLSIQRSRELWCRLQLRYRVAVAVAVASSYNSDSTRSLGTSICHGYSPKKNLPPQKKTQKNKNKNRPGFKSCHSLTMPLSLSFPICKKGLLGCYNKPVDSNPCPSLLRQDTRGEAGFSDTWCHQLSRFHWIQGRPEATHIGQR